MSVPKLRFKEFNGKWEDKKLGEITLKVGSGSTPRGGESVYQSKGIPFIRSQNVKNESLMLDDLVYISEDINSQMQGSIVKADDILLNITGASIGRTCVVPSNFKTGNVNQHVCIIRLKDGYSSNFLQPYLSSDRGQKSISSSQVGSGREGLNFQAIRLFRIAMPSFQEQNKIADFLMAVDEKIAQLMQKCELLARYKKGVMQQIFSQELRFKDDDGSDFPDWEEKTLGDVFKYKNGKSLENEIAENGQYFLITLNSIDISGKLKTDNNHKRVSNTDFSLRKNDLVMILSDVAHGNFLGLTDIIPSDKYVLNQRIGGLRAKTNIEVKFASLYINFNQKYFKLHGQGSSQLNLSKGDVLDFNLPILHNKEQTKIANFLTSIDEKITEAQSYLDTVKQYKQGLLQQMFV